jgi:hypothetical protein
MAGPVHGGPAPGRPQNSSSCKAKGALESGQVKVCEQVRVRRLLVRVSVLSRAAGRGRGGRFWFVAERSRSQASIFMFMNSDIDTRRRTAHTWAVQAAHAQPAKDQKAKCTTAGIEG